MSRKPLWPKQNHWDAKMSWKCGNVNGNNTRKTTKPSGPSIVLRQSLQTHTTKHFLCWTHQRRQAQPSHRKRWRGPFRSISLPSTRGSTWTVGHPDIVHEPGGTDISTYFSLMKCRIFPPYGLFQSVWPHCSGGKLTLPLCRKVVLNEQPKPLTEQRHHCVYTGSERCLVGT